MPTQPTLFDHLADLRWQSALVFLVAFALYVNTLGHGYVLDDGLVLQDNAYVQKGIRGIPDILSRDSFHGTLGESAYLSGGRYRPLSLVMFAFEVSFFGMKPFAHHLINVLLYGLTAVVLLRLFRNVVFKEPPLAALAATLLFVVHPVHTEVVANIKSRDEILSLLFLLYTLGYLLREGSSTTTDRWKAAGCYALALLSKENGIVLLGIAPLALFIFAGRSWSRALRDCWPLSVVALAYVALRLLLIGSRMQDVPGVLDNPYVLAATDQKLATILSVIVSYLRLLVWPHPLAYDYSFAQVPYRDFSDTLVWAGAMLLAILVAFSVRALVRRDLFGWCAAFFLATLLLVSNLFFNIGAPMAERFLYQASVPFLIAVVELGRRGLSSAGILNGRGLPVAASIMALLCIPQAWRTIDRNGDWKDRDDLLLQDVQVSSHSARANTYAGIACIRKCQSIADKNTQRDFAAQALVFFARADSIVPDYLPVLLNRGAAYFLLDSIPAAEISWDLARALEPENTMLKSYEALLFDHYYRQGLKAGTERNFPAAIAALEKSVRYGPGKADAWYNLGGAYFTAGDTAKARTSWDRTLQLDPRNMGAQQGLNALRR
jgi:tetratricopeptide (TPR) repeat protein